MTRSIQVLHVDDEPEFAELTATFLERENAALNVRTATSAADGLAMLRTAAIDCIVSDHDMPGMSGIEFLNTIREDHPELPFILFTGKGSEEVASKAVSADTTDYLQKRAGTEQYTLLANRIENAVDRFRSQRAVAEQKRQLETLVDNLPGIVYQCRNDPGWPMESVKGDCEHLTGYPASELEDGPVDWGEDVVHPADHGPLWEEIQEALEHDEQFECTYRIRTEDGETRWVWERGGTVQAPMNGVDILEGFIMDITSAKKHDRRFEAIFDDPNLLVGLLDVDGTTRDINRTAMEVVDVERDEVLGDPFWETPWWDESLRSDVEEWIDAAAAGEYVEYDAVHPTGDGSFVTVEGSFRPVLDDETVTAIVVSAKDVSERKARERDLRRHTERFDKFASFVSHDLQSPIATVQGRLDLALETRDFEHVERATEAMDRVEQLRQDIVRTLQTGELVSETELVDIDSVMDSVWTTLDPPEAASFTVVDSVSIDADPDAFQRLVENLVANSIEHGHARISIRLGGFDGGMYYEDSGGGIDPADRDHVFTPGFSTKTGDEGIGMGLASVRQIVLAHGWEIRIDDGNTLPGVRFEIRTE